MGKFGAIDNLVDKTNANSLYSAITLGEVINSDDPQQMGRLQVFVPALDNTKSQDVPWAYYSSPFGGLSDADGRGPDSRGSNGPVAYGMWAIPKTGATVLVMCIDNNPDIRVWLGCIHGFQFPHTMPHGRYVNDDGPLSSSEGQIQPLYDSLTQAFTSTASQVVPRDSYEFQTRGADRPASTVNSTEVGTTAQYSSVPDDTEQQGYGTDNHADRSSKHSNIYSLTTPGFHALSMDDNNESCRIRMRTTSGNQVILDDTNERIYISTAKGKTWIELDEEGTLDVYSEQDISLRSQQDINIVSDKSVRIAGKQGIHLSTQQDIRQTAGRDFHLKVSSDTRINVDSIFITATTDMHFTAEGDTRIKATNILQEGLDSINMLSGTIELGSTVNISGPVGITGRLDVLGLVASGTDVTTPTHSLNTHTHTYVLPKIPDPNIQPGITTTQLAPTGGLSSASASPNPAEPEQAESLTAYFVSRAPQHEPYARVYLDMNTTDTDEVTLDVFDSLITNPDIISEYDYVSDDVGRGSSARGKIFNRNTKWQR